MKDATVNGWTPAELEARATQAYRAHWHDIAPEYDAVMGRDPSMEALRSRIVEEIPPDPGTILDLGTGSGALLEIIREQCHDCELMGLDPAPAMLEKAQEKMAGDPKVRFLHASADQLELPSQSVDVIVSNFALHHLEHRQKRVCAHEMFRVLKPGGRLIFGDQHCPEMGEPSDLGWSRQVLSLFTRKAQHYLETAGRDRMLLQVRLLPRILTADGEVMASVDFWIECLEEADFAKPRVIVIEPEFLLHRVIVAERPAG
ncbi:MAG: class I SAM-dependent methyltransferase [bacterium]|nr:class I SAM-dependent methyltransferase [bacterium]